MAKKYELKNTTFKPARPIGVMTGNKTQSYRQINTDGLPVTLEESEYKACKDAIDRHVKAGTLSVNILEYDDGSIVEADEFDWQNCEDEDELLAYAATKGLELDARATPNSIKKKLAELEA